MFSIEKASNRKERQDLFVCFSNQGALPASSFLNWTGHAAAAAGGNNSVGRALALVQNLVATRWLPLYCSIDYDCLVGFISFQ